MGSPERDEGSWDDVLGNIKPPIPPSAIKKIKDGLEKGGWSVSELRGPEYNSPRLRQILVERAGCTGLKDAYFTRMTKALQGNSLPHTSDTRSGRNPIDSPDFVQC